MDDYDNEDDDDDDNIVDDKDEDVKLIIKVADKMLPTFRTMYILMLVQYLK